MAMFQNSQCRWLAKSQCQVLVPGLNVAKVLRDQPSLEKGPTVDPRNLHDSADKFIISARRIDKPHILLHNIVDIYSWPANMQPEV